MTDDQRTHAEITARLLGPPPDSIDKATLTGYRLRLKTCGEAATNIILQSEKAITGVEL